MSIVKSNFFALGCFACVFCDWLCSHATFKQIATNFADDIDIILCYMLYLTKNVDLFRIWSLVKTLDISIPHNRSQAFYEAGFHTNQV